AEELVLQEMKMSRELLRDIAFDEEAELFQASMGIYVFNRNVLIESLQNDLADFGKHIIPQSIKDRRVGAFIFTGYWKTSEPSVPFMRQTSALPMWCPNTVFSSPRRPFTRIRGFFRGARSTAPRCVRRSFQTGASFPMRIWNDAWWEYAA